MLTTKQFTQLVTDIATHLPGNWTVGEIRTGYESHATTFTETATSLPFHLSADGYQNKNRISVSGSWPHDDQFGYGTFYPNDSPSITAAYKRGAAALAKDIEHRFLPDYTSLYFEHRTSMHTYQQKHRNAIQMNKTAAHHMGGRYWRSLNGNGTGGASHGTHSTGAANVEFSSYKQSFDLKFDNIPPHVTFELLKTYRQLTQITPPSPNLPQQIALI